MTAGSRSVFYGLGAWVGQQLGPTTVKWWPVDPTTLQPAFDQSRLITSNLANNPQAVRNGKLQAAAVEVDDGPTTGGSTRLGPTFPTGQGIHSCWIESNKYNALPAGVKPPRVGYGMQCRDYELTTAVYWSGPLANRRFWGFHAQITSEQGHKAMCTIWKAGYSLDPNQKPAGSWWIQLDHDAHPIEPGFTEIGVGAGVAKEGALFLDAQTAGNLQLSGPKLPPALGSDFYPAMR